MDNLKCFVADKWKDYELIDSGDNKRLERWGDFLLIRPDPQALWPSSNIKLWKKADAIYHRSSKGGGSWEFFKDFPSSWSIKYRDLVFKIQPTGFKHMGLFPEQAYNWDKISENVDNGDRILNLFGYTGAASIAAAKYGADVVHVDAAKGMLAWCNDNASLSDIKNGKIRLILDDCLKFVEREKRRGNKYEGIIMDPPSFGRGAKGEVWKLEYNLLPLLCACKDILSNKAKFFVINSYTAGVSPLVVLNMIKSLNLSFSNIDYGELALPFRKNMLLPCGLTIWVQF